MYYSMADLTIEMDATGRTAQQAAYLAAGETPPAITVSCAPVQALPLFLSQPPMRWGGQMWSGC